MRWWIAIALAACGAPGAGGTGPDASATGDGMSDGSMVDGMMMPPGAPTAAQLLGALATCTRVGGNYATDSGGTQNIQICGLANAVFWKADLDVDCDGKMSMQCNIMTDPSFQAQTSATDSHGAYLDAAALPYVVVPLPSTRFNYETAGLAFGSVIAVIYQDKVVYGVFGDEGPTSIIGEASYRMAQLLGIDPDPSTGGADSGVAYIAFTGASAVVPVIEDHDMATMLGVAKARTLLGL